MDIAGEDEWWIATPAKQGKGKVLELEAGVGEGGFEATGRANSPRRGLREITNINGNFTDAKEEDIKLCGVHNVYGSTPGTFLKARLGIPSDASHQAFSLSLSDVVSPSDAAILAPPSCTMSSSSVPVSKLRLYMKMNPAVSPSALGIGLSPTTSSVAASSPVSGSTSSSTAEVEEADWKSNRLDDDLKGEVDAEIDKKDEEANEEQTQAHIQSFTVDVDVAVANSDRKTRTQAQGKAALRRLIQARRARGLLATLQTLSQCEIAKEPEHGDFLSLPSRLAMHHALCVSSSIVDCTDPKTGSSPIGASLVARKFAAQCEARQVLVHSQELTLLDQKHEQEQEENEVKTKKAADSLLVEQEFEVEEASSPLGASLRARKFAAQSKAKAVSTDFKNYNSVESSCTTATIMLDAASAPFPMPFPVEEAESEGEEVVPFKMAPSSSPSSSSSSVLGESHSKSKGNDKSKTRSTSASVFASKEWGISLWEISSHAVVALVAIVCFVFALLDAAWQGQAGREVRTKTQVVSAQKKSK